ncbi:hypothetical protein Patl1_37546 [Pistacia atlantica]|nr:hypothetical protein Patl1_37546 [Pistacia atlantica]
MKTYSMAFSVEESPPLNSENFYSDGENEDDSEESREKILSQPLSREELRSLLTDSERQKLVKKLSEANQQNRYLKRQLYITEDALVNFKSKLAVLELEIQALVSFAEEIAQSSIPEGSGRINGKFIQSHLLSQFEAVHEKVKEQIKDVDTAQSKEVPLFWCGMAESVQVMGTFDGWSQGEHLSPDYDGSFTRFSTTLMLRPGRIERWWRKTIDDDGGRGLTAVGVEENRLVVVVSLGFTSLPCVIILCINLFPLGTQLLFILVDTGTDNPSGDPPAKLSAAGISTWAKILKIPQLFAGTQEDSPPGSSAKSSFARFTSGFGLHLSPKSPQAEDVSEGTSTTAQSGLIGTITKGLVDSSKSAVKAVQVEARYVVSQNKRRYQNIIAMGFPAGDMSSGFFGYVEGFYQNHMEGVIKFFETYHKDKYKVYNLCSERLYDASLFEGKVASFPFDDHNCPPIQLIISFCHSAYSWLKQDIENVVVVHYKGGMARTWLMISSLLLYLKFFPTTEESIDYYNQKRCVDGKGLVLPSQIPHLRCLLSDFRLYGVHLGSPHITRLDHNGVLLRPFCFKIYPAVTLSSSTCPRMS